MKSSGSWKFQRLRIVVLILVPVLAIEIPFLACIPISIKMPVVLSHPNTASADIGARCVIDVY
jgi:hypothetical protein